MDNMNNMHPGRKIVWVFIAIGALAIFTMAIVSYVSSQERAALVGTSQVSGAKANKAPVKTVVTDVKPETSPEFFPKDMPSEPGATVVKNYNTSTPDGRKIGTRVYVTAKTVDDNYSLFQDYFKNAGWQVTAAPVIKGSTSKTMLATKGNMQAQVTIGDDPVAKAKTVAIIFTQTPAK